MSEIVDRRPQTVVEGAADYDRQRFVSRADIDRPDVVASYDHAVFEGNTYEKILKLKPSAAPAPKFESKWSSPEPWAPDKNAFSVVPLLPVPFVGEYYFDFRAETANIDEARRRAVVDAVLTTVTPVGEEEQRGTPTVHYRLGFNRERAKQALRDELAKTLFSYPESAPASAEADVWVDHEGRIRKFVRASSETSRSE